jgi:hypothetical protein
VNRRLSLLLRLFLGWVLLPPISAGFFIEQSTIAQSSDRSEPGANDTPEGPYRRVFVRDSDLPLEGYRAIDRESFRGMLEKRKKLAADRDPNAPNFETELRSFHAQVRLVGADLVSERSRLRWNWDRNNFANQSGARRLIAPWSPAISPSLRLGGSQPPNSPSPPGWMYDLDGKPMVRATSEEEWFSWSLRPLSTSTPNRLNYAPSFPLTIDGCLVLQLPKNFRVVDANIVVRLADHWNQVTERFGDWPTTLAADNIPELNPTDAFWLLELSGRDQASFSIVVNSNRGFDNTLGSTDVSGSSCNRLIARQTVAHTATAQHVKTTCDWDWYESTTLDRTFRISVPEGMRLRNLKLNDRETAVRFVDRVIELAIPMEDSAAVVSAGGASRTRVSAEFLSAISDLGVDSKGKVRVPPVACLNGYVVAGTTSLASEGSFELRDIGCETGRLETARNANDQLERLDFSWFQSPPEISFAIAPKAWVESAEILTQLSTDANRLVAVVKMQLSPWRVSSPNLIRVEGSWSVETTQINQQGLELTVLEPDSSSTATNLRIDPRGPVDGGPIQIELLLARGAIGSLDSSIPTASLLDLPGRETIQTLVIEPGYASRLDYGGDDLFRDTCDEETLTPWQRDRLPRLGRFLLFRMPQGRLPILRWKADPVLVQCNIATTLNDEDDRIRIEHLLDFRRGELSPEAVRIQLPGEWRWEWDTPSGWTRFSAKHGPERNEWLLEDPWRGEASVSTDSSTSRVRRFRAIAYQEKSDEPWQLPLPRLSGNQSATYSLETDSSVRVIPDQSRDPWEFDPDGNLILRWQDPIPNASPMSFCVDTNDRGAPNRCWIPQSELHVAVDSQGQQLAVLELNTRGIPDTPLEFSLMVPSSWSVERILDANAEPLSSDIADSFSVRNDGGRLIFQQRTMSDFRVSFSELTLVLAGPKLEQSGFLPWGIFSPSRFLFSWPEIVLEGPFPETKRILWIPDTVQVTDDSLGASARSMEKDPALAMEGIWSAWRWSTEAASWLGWNRPERGPKDQTARSTRGSALPPRTLLPGWFAEDWKRAFVGDGNAKVYVLQPEPSRTIPALWLVVAILLSYSLLHRAPWICLLFAVVATIAGHWFPDSLAIGFRSAWVGFSIGALIYLIVWTTASPGARPSDRQVPSEQPWQPWNEPGLSNDSLSDSNHRAAIIASLGLIFSTVLGLPIFAQDTVSKSAARAMEEKPFDVLIPLDAEGKPVGDVVYIPERIATAMEPTPSTVLSPDRDSYIISARHALRFDARSISFGNTEQPCIHTYELWIGQAGVGRPLRIPFSTDRSRLSRLLVDSIEVASSRFAKSDNELIWYPDRSGRRILQIESQIRIRPADREKNETNALESLSGDLRIPRAWTVDAPILPAGNATLEIETDTGWSVDFNRRGRFSNPSIGKFSIQLGNQDRLVGEMTPDEEATSFGGRVPVSEAGPLVSLESPQMNTELFIDRGQLLARTIVEYPRASEAPEEIELESDLQWQPIGNLWGDAKLIDVRPGGTLDRRRYVVRWISDANGHQGKRSISTTWIPVGNANLRNVVFAECRDRRVRPNTLRYARTAGSSWMLEGINTWIPSINTKERIEWMDLNERPIATRVRIPINGGFGVLRQQPASEVSRAKVFHQWSFGSDRATIRSRIEFASPASNRKHLVLSIPSRYTVAEVLFRNTPLIHTEWSVGDRRFIQVLIDREVGDVSDLVIVGEQDISQLNTLSSAFPYVEAEELTIAEQFVEIFADPVWRLRLPIQTDPSDHMGLRGRGIGKPLISMSLPDPTESESIQLDRMKGAWNGPLTAGILAASESELRWELRLQATDSIDAKPSIVVSLPHDMSRDWTSKASIRELPSLDPTRRWIQIQPDWSNGESDCSFAIEWMGDPKAFRDRSWINRIRFESEPGLECQLNQDTVSEIFAEQSDEHSAIASGLEGSASTDPSLCRGLEVHRLQIDPQNPNRVCSYSSWWIDPATWHGKTINTLEWELPLSARIRWVSVNGQGVAWKLDRTRLLIDLPLLAIPIRIDLWSDHDTATENGRGQQAIPTLIRGDSGCPAQGWLIAEGRISRLDGQMPDPPVDPGLSLRREICRGNLDILNALVRLRSEIEQSTESQTTTWYRWWDHLKQETRSLLIDWATDTEFPDSEAYQAMSASYLGLSSVSEDKRFFSRDLLNEKWHDGVDASLCRQVLDQSIAGRMESVGDPQWTRILAAFSMGCIVILVPWIWRILREPMRRRAWWSLTLIGVGAWLLTGSWFPALILISMGLFLAIDSYWILNGRFRQTGTPAPR